MDPADSTSAYEFGRTVGFVLVPAILFLVFAGYSLSLFLWGRQRHAGWIVATAVCSLPLIGIFVAMVFGIFFTLNRPRLGDEESPRPPGEAADLLAGTFEPLPGKNFDYTVSVPDRRAWKSQPAMGDFDRVISYRDLYIGIIAERVGVGDVERLREFVEQTLTANSDSHHLVASESLTIDGRPWVAFDAEATRQKMRFRYRYYLYTDNRRSVQIIAWTSPALFKPNKPVIEQIAQSFHFGKD